MSVPSDKNTATKEFERSKYNNLEIEIEKMWHLEIRTIPVVVGAPGMIKKGTHRNTITIIQKAALNSTAHNLRRAS